MLEQYKILYAEDEKLTRKQISQTLKFLFTTVIEAVDGVDAWEKFQLYKPDIIIADIEMPRLNGLELTKKIRSVDSTVPIVIITAYTSVEYFMKAIDLNLTKYLLKPVKLSELEKALALCKDNIVPKEEERISLQGDDFFDIKLQQLIVQGTEVHIAYHERELFKLLLKNRHRMVTYQEIFSYVWNSDSNIGTLQSVISSLRKKLPPQVYIENISKTGYRLFIIKL